VRATKEGAGGESRRFDFLCAAVDQFSCSLVVIIVVLADWMY
jgi:hypothetical protein